MAEESQIVYLEPSLLQTNPLQPRGLISPESLVDLVDSIREHGILEPIVVAETPAGYQIIAGERRWRAAKIVGLEKVPCIIRKTSHRGMLEMAIVENLQRVDLNPLERAQGFKRMMGEFGLGTAEIAQRVGKSQSFVSNSLRLLSLPDALKDALLSGIVTEGHIRALAAIEDSAKMVEALRQILREEGSVRRAEELAREFKAKANIQTKTPQARIYSDEMVELERKLGSKIGGKVKVAQSMKAARLIIQLKGNVQLTTDKIRKISEALDQAFNETDPKDESKETVTSTDSIAPQS